MVEERTTLELGALLRADGTQFRVWAPQKTSVAVEIEGRGRFAMQAGADGYFSTHVSGVGAGSRYWFVVDGSARHPDPASRWQPDGSDGPSVVAGTDFPWTDEAWAGVSRYDQVVYEMHIGTFTEEGTWESAAQRLPLLRDIGITVVQLMPIGTFKGRFGWGYDTTLPYAPFAPYGTPDDMRSFVNRAHELGLGVILDVVYNHPGLGEHYSAYTEHYFSDRPATEWGPGFNYDAEFSRPVRDFVVGNAVYWIECYHLDGLRVDAVQALLDESSEHILTEITRAVRNAARHRETYVVVENQPQERRMILPSERGGCGVDAMYNDDFHHAVHVAATGHNDFYYADYRGTPQEMLSSLKYGFLYQGQRSNMRNEAYGTYNLDTPVEHFLHFLENHDQVANSARGWRLGGLVSPSRIRAITAMLLLGPQTPCLFQGQEFGSSRPFFYFLDVEGPDEAAKVAEGRMQSLDNFPGVHDDPVLQGRLPNPTQADSFAASKLDWGELAENGELVTLHRDLLSLRHNDRAFSQKTDRRIDGAVIAEQALLLRFITPDPQSHRLMLVNLGRDLPLDLVAEPLLGPCEGFEWRLAWSSEHPDYGGAGRRLANPKKPGWVLPGDCAIVLRCAPTPQ